MAYDSRNPEDRNEWIDLIAKRLKVIGGYPMDDLRSLAGFGCRSRADAIQSHKHCKRGELLSIIIEEEFRYEIH